MKKLLNNHISKPTCTLEEWLQRQHSPEEIMQRLRLAGDARKAQFDTDDSSKEFSAKEISFELETLKVENQSTVYETDKLRAIGNAYKEVSAKQAETAE